jgi:hypothetical protein
MFVVNPDPYLLPTYRISPFSTHFLTVNEALEDDDYCDSYLNKKFATTNWIYTLNGREAIERALEYYNLQKDDIVTILTSSGNKYISSCVTSSIEKFCNWNQEIITETKVLFVNHEFGHPFPEMQQLVNLNIPIIEDCCTTFFSQDDYSKIGKYGDFSIYSFPKFFPLQIGGALLSNQNEIVKESSILNEEQKKYIKKSVSFHLRQENEFLANRKQKFDYALEKFRNLGFSLRFKEKINTVPSVLLLKNNGIITDLNALKSHFTKYGIQNSIFYGEDAFFIPNHQTLTLTDIDYIYNCLLTFIRNN